MIPYLLAIAGGYLIGSGMKDNAVKFGNGGSIQDKLDNLNTKGLDRYERMVYDDMIMKGRSKTEALMILINQVEGDYSQLSPSLRKIALDMEDEMTGEMEGERRMGMDDDLSEISFEDLSGNYTPSGKMYEVLIIFKELEKDGGRKYPSRYYINTNSEEEAKKIAERMWKEENTDYTDLAIVSISVKEDKMAMAKGGVTKKGDVGKSGTQYGYTLKEYETMAKKNGLLVSPSDYWKSQIGKKYKDFLGRTQTIGNYSSDKENIMRSYGYKIAIGMDLGSKLIPASAKRYVEQNNYNK